MMPMAAPLPHPGRCAIPSAEPAAHPTTMALGPNRKASTNTTPGAQQGQPGGVVRGEQEEGTERSEAHRQNHRDDEVGLTRRRHDHIPTRAMAGAK